MTHTDQPPLPTPAERENDAAQRRRVRAMITLSDAIADQLTAGHHIPCIAQPELYTPTVKRGNQGNTGKARIHACATGCQQCPVRELCRTYSSTALPITGITASQAQTASHRAETHEPRTGPEYWR